ncbi:MAG TPA: hypothetical protein VMU84_00060 [Thermoanaerobaculia bacterium]|nr:hypothetical protein [Thermoanaerobaculia bacterium]
MKRVGFVLLSTFLPISLLAWTPASEERIAKKSAALAPPDLRLVIDRFEDDYARGLLKAQNEEGADAHTFILISRRGRLRDTIERETRSIINAIRTGEPMPNVVARLGTLAHYVGDANNPFHLNDSDPRLTTSKDDFERYLESRLPKFPTVFYGLDPRFHLATYLDRTFARTAKFYPLLQEEYFRDGARRTSASFDDRSTAFGVASVCYSRSVSDLVNLYYFIWKEAGGDVRSASLMTRGNLLLNAN